MNTPEQIAFGKMVCETLWPKGSGPEHIGECAHCRYPDGLVREYTEPGDRGRVPLCIGCARVLLLGRFDVERVPEDKES